jgi:sulfonate transport system ATP-binding protein
MSNGRIDIQGVSRQFQVDGRRMIALQDIDLGIAPGEFVSIVGTSGCGKSTLLRLIAGLDTGSSGQIAHDGVTIAGPSLRRGLVFQDARLFPWLTVVDNVAVALANTKLSRAERQDVITEMIALVGLRGFERAWPHQLSGGMAQRAAIARGLVNRPGVLLLDEPFGALDALTRARLQDELLSIWARERTTTVLVTHDVDEAVYLGDRVVVMSPRPGRIKHVLDVPLPRPRDRSAAAFGALRRDVLAMLEGDHGVAAAAEPERRVAPGLALGALARSVFGRFQGARA